MSWLCAQEMCSDGFGEVEQEEWGPPDFILCQGRRHKAVMSPVEPGWGRAGGQSTLCELRSLHSLKGLQWAEQGRWLGR
jgi:hypothetical protein